MPASVEVGPLLAEIDTLLTDIFGLALYVFAVGYAVAPFVGLTGTLSSASLAGFVSGLPFAVKLALKVPLAAAASYHTWNGFRHLAWDSGRGESIDRKLHLSRGCDTWRFHLLMAHPLSIQQLSLSRRSTRPVTSSLV